MLAIRSSIFNFYMISFDSQLMPDELNYPKQMMYVIKIYTGSFDIREKFLFELNYDGRFVSFDS